MAEVTEIENVPKDIEDWETCVITNPTKTKFTHQYGGVDMVLPAGKPVNMALSVACIIGHNLAKQLVQKEHDEYVASLPEGKDRKIAEEQAIPNFQKRVWEKMKEIIKTDSKFFKEQEKKRAGERMIEF